MKIILVEGITDVNLVRYIYSKMNKKYHFDDFEASKRGRIVTFKNNHKQNLIIINLKGQDNLEFALQEIIKPMESEIIKLGIITDADQNFTQSSKAVTDAIEHTELKKSKIDSFLTPNNKDLGNLETLLLSSLNKENIPQLQCFKHYKECLKKDILNIEQRAIHKHEVEAYIKFSEQPRNKNQAQFSFIDKGKETGLWDLSNKEFQPIIQFVESIVN